MATTPDDPRYVPPGYDLTQFDRPSLTADFVILTETKDGTKVLLVKRGNHPYKGFWALPGGFADAGETITETARRELEEETGVSNVEPQQFNVYSAPERDPRGWVVSVGFVATLSQKQIKKNPPKAADDADAVMWANVEDLPELAFDHHEILHDALAHYRGT